MSYKVGFNTFHPSLLPVQQVSSPSFRSDLNCTRILVCGEVHGVRENANIVYSLCRHHDIRTVAIEPSSREVAAFVDSATSLSPDFSSIDKAFLVGGVLSVEMAKAIAIMLKDGVIDRISYLGDGVADAPNIEEGFASSIRHASKESPVICIVGNWHSEPRAIRTPAGLHRSALMRVRDFDATTVYLEFRYSSGSFYNLGTGLATFASKNNFGKEIRLEAGHGVRNYVIRVPNAHAITYA